MSCKKGNGLDSLKNATNIHLLYLDALKAKTFKENVKYIDDRKVLKDFNLSKSDKEKLIEVIIKKDNYEPISRKCEHEPVYALMVDNKLVALFDVEYCPYLQYIKEDGSKETFQLKTNSLIKKEIKKIVYSLE